MNRTLELIREMRMSGMADALITQQEQPSTYQEMAFEERLLLLLDQEHSWRDGNRHRRLLRQAKLRLNAHLKDIDYQHSRGLNKSQMAELSQLQWLDQKQNLLISGPCGSGKTWLACALAQAACQKGHSCRYYRISRMMRELEQAKADGSYPKVLKQIARYQLLILDDWGLEPLQGGQRNDLMEIMDDRHQNSSTLVISQLPTTEWYHSIGDSTIADAILDRLMHNAHRLNLKGESMRKKAGEKLAQNEHLN